MLSTGGVQKLVQKCGRRGGAQYALYRPDRPDRQSLLQAVFLLIGQWDYTVLLGNLLGAATAIGNFFIMAQTVSKALSQGDKDNASKKTQLSRSMRMLTMALVCIIGHLAPCFNLFAVAIPLVFPSIGAYLSGLLMKK